jgi:hypothetical protein
MQTNMSITIFVRKGFTNDDVDAKLCQYKGPGPGLGVLFGTHFQKAAHRDKTTHRTLRYCSGELGLSSFCFFPGILSFYQVKRTPRIHPESLGLSSFWILPLPVVFFVLYQVFAVFYQFFFTFRYGVSVFKVKEPALRKARPITR